MKSITILHLPNKQKYFKLGMVIFIHFFYELVPLFSADNGTFFLSKALNLYTFFGSISLFENSSEANKDLDILTVKN